MLRRIAQLFGYQEKPDEALARRFAKMRQQYGQPTQAPDQHLDVLTHVRAGLNIRTVVGAEKTTGETLRKTLLESYARVAESKEELVGAKK